MKEVIRKLCAHTHLTQEEAKAAMISIMDGEATPAQVAAFMVALLMKGETAEEIYGCAVAMRERAEKVQTKRQGLTDTCGTGGDGKGTFNVSTMAAIIAAGAGLPVAKHGNRSVSSLCGSADLLEALGVRLELTPEELGRCLDETGIAFLFAPLLHKAMQYAAGPRKEVGVPSVFNLIGPLSNPAGAKRQVLGVYDPDKAGLLAEVLAMLGAERALVVHGADGSDELTLAGESLAFEVKDGRVVRRMVLSPEAVGMNRAAEGAIKGGEPSLNAMLALEVLQGKGGPYRDVSLFNAAAALYVGELAENLAEGVRLAAQAVDSGAALAKLEDLKKFTGRCKRDAAAGCNGERKKNS